MICGCSGNPALTTPLVANPVVNERNDQIFNSLTDLIAFTNQAANQAMEILERHIHDRVGGILANLEQYMRRADLFE